MHVLRKLVGYLGVVFVGVTLLGALPAYFYQRVDQTGAVVDGYGRAVTPTPEFMQQLIEQWRGPAWLVFDILVFWGGLLIGAFLIEFGFGIREARRERLRARLAQFGYTIPNPDSKESQLVHPIHRSPSLDALAETAQRLEQQRLKPQDRTEFGR